MLIYSWEQNTSQGNYLSQLRFLYFYIRIAQKKLWEADRNGFLPDMPKGLERLLS